LRRVRIDREERHIEIESQRRKLDAEKTDLLERLKFNELIRRIHIYPVPYDTSIEHRPCTGAFVEEGDRDPHRS
jgi:hypothetical protein